MVDWIAFAKRNDVKRFFNGGRSTKKANLSIAKKHYGTSVPSSYARNVSHYREMVVNRNIPLQSRHDAYFLYITNKVTMDLRNHGKCKL